MFRLLLTYILPLLLPLALYLAWNAFARWRAEKTGGEPPSLEKGAIFWSLIIGFVLLMIGLAVLAVTGGDAPDAGRYVPPRLEDGRVVPPTYIPEEEAR